MRVDLLCRNNEKLANETVIEKLGRKSSQLVSNETKKNLWNWVKNKIRGFNGH